MINVEETYTDNVRLAPKGAERDDWVTSVRPGVAATYLGPRSRLSATYTPQFVYRANEGSNDVFHYLNATGNAELVRRLLFVDASAYVTQQNISLTGPQAQSNINSSSNRTSVRSYSLSPYLRHEFGQEALGELRYTHNTVDYTSGSLFSSDSDRVDARVASGRAYKLLTWNAAYTKERITYSQSGQSLDMESESVGARRLLTPTIGILGNVGYEDNNYAAIGPAPRGKFWNVGPEWTPTPRTRLAATAGRRFFGPTRSLEFTHRTRLTGWRLEYNEDITTARSLSVVPTTTDTAALLDALLQTSIPDTARRQATVQGYITQAGLPPNVLVPLNYITLVPFLQKRWLGSFTIQGVRNSVGVDVFSQTRDAVAVAPLVGGDVSISPHTKQVGAGANWTHRLGPHTSTNVRLSRIRSELSSLAREDNLTYLWLVLNHEFQPRLSGAVTIRRLQNQSNQSGGTYRENAISVVLSMRF